jgi:hypothetical protein
MWINESMTLKEHILLDRNITLAYPACMGNVVCQLHEEKLMFLLSLLCGSLSLATWLMGEHIHAATVISKQVYKTGKFSLKFFASCIRILEVWVSDNHEYCMYKQCIEPTSSIKCSPSEAKYWSVTIFSAFHGTLLRIIPRSQKI